MCSFPLVTMISLPASPAAFADAVWSDIAPYYDALATVPLATPPVDGEMETWLATWSRLDTLVGEAGTLAMIAYTGNTADPDAEKAYLRFSMAIFPKLEEQQVRLARRLVDTGWSRPDLGTTIRRFRSDIEIFREANVPRFAQLEEYSAAYQKRIGGLSVDWEGERKTIPQLAPFLKDPDREVRTRAFRVGAEAYLAHRDELAALFDRMLALRQDVAREAGFADFQRFAFAAKHRFDYTPEDCAGFHAAVQEAVVPAVARLYEYRRQRLGVDTLRPWDLAVELDATTPLVPFRTTEEFVNGARRVFAQVDGELGDWFDIMAREQLLDLESRPGKAPGGYCTDLAFRGRPFIFMNAVGVPDDVQTLVHEAGHCFHDFSTHRLPYTWQRRTGHEAAELASMSMELLAMPYLAQPHGYYTPDEARVAWIEHFEDVLTSLTHIASVDAFQAWIYAHPQGGDAVARDAAWLDIRARFEPVVDWSGLERERLARWYRQLHIFELPFYYIEYGLAQLGALQVFRNAVCHGPEAVEAYKRFLALGGTRPLPALYAEAGVKLVFDTETMRELVSFVEEQIAALRGGSRHPFGNATAPRPGTATSPAATAARSRTVPQ
jgi:oligoendopeptidase F